MAVFAAVTWQDGDEVTSAKLQQMAQNEQYCKDNLVIGHVSTQASPAGTYPTGHTAGIWKLDKVQVVATHYDSVSAVTQLNITVTWPQVFTGPVWPVVCNMELEANGTVARMYSHSNTSALVSIFNTAGQAGRMRGTVYTAVFSGTIIA